tara:strand:+ start:1195 stop:2286 length:1092 start_codon:yes stop_codon:yes gene_type:complete
MSEVCLNFPLQHVSFGQLGIALSREAYRRDLNPAIFPHGQVDIASQREDADFRKWLEDKLNSSLKNFSRKKYDSTFKIWHLNPESLFRITQNQNLLSFYELDSPTEMELNVVKNNDTTYFTSQYTVDKFKEHGADNVKYLPLFFDSFNFKRVEKQFYNDNRITFNLCGKFEKRKHHAKVISSWVKKYGNDKKYYLNCSIYNHFLQPKENQDVIMKLFGSSQPFNVNFVGYMPQNSIYNDYLNSGDILIGMSGGEGWGLPEFQSVAMGKHSVILNCNGYKSWANESNSVLVQPNGKIPAYDGRFFQKGSGANQGGIFDFDEDSFIEGCEQAIKRLKENKVNEEGLKLQDEFTVSKTFDAILRDI